MAGTPNKRAKRDALKQAAGQLPNVAPQPTPAPPPSIPDATRAPARAHDARARARPMPPSPTRAPAMGRTTHAAIDEQTAKSVRTLANVIAPGLTLRLSRVRPTWAMGFIEDYPVNEGESLSAFYEYVRDEHGGQTYKVEVLGAGDVQLFEGGISIAGPVRVGGRVVNRARFEGRDDDTPARAVAAPSSSSSGMHDLEVFKLILGMQRESNEAQLASVTGLVNRTSETTAQLLGALAQRDANAKPDSFVEQLAQIVDASTALDKVRKVIAPPARAQRASADDDDDDMKLATKAVKKAFFENVAAGFMKTLPAAPGRPPMAQQPQARPPKPRGNPQGFIPDARSAGQNRAEN
ncbi:MAG: hypothetical protein ACOYD1_12745 [Candidatus Nanopelagicales bacterium]